MLLCCASLKSGSKQWSLISLYVRSPYSHWRLAYQEGTYVTQVNKEKSNAIVIWFFNQINKHSEYLFLLILIIFFSYYFYNFDFSIASNVIVRGSGVILEWGHWNGIFRWKRDFYGFACISGIRALR